MNIQKIAPFAAMAVGAVLALATSAFKATPAKSSNMVTHGAPATTTYYYTYVGAQTVTERNKGTNYTMPQTSPLGCDEGSNECSVAVSVTSSTTPPANISSLSITHDANGFPNGGSNYEDNFLQD